MTIARAGARALALLAGAALLMMVPACCEFGTEPLVPGPGPDPNQQLYGVWQGALTVTYPTPPPQVVSMVLRISSTGIVLELGGTPYPAVLDSFADPRIAFRADFPDTGYEATFNGQRQNLGGGEQIAGTVSIPDTNATGAWLLTKGSIPAQRPARAR